MEETGALFARFLETFQYMSINRNSGGHSVTSTRDSNHRSLTALKQTSFHQLLARVGGSLTIMPLVTPIGGPSTDT